MGSPIWRRAGSAGILHDPRSSPCARRAGRILLRVVRAGVLLLQDMAGVCRLEQVFVGSVHHIPGHVAHRLINTGETQLGAGGLARGRGSRLRCVGNARLWPAGAGWGGWHAPHCHFCWASHLKQRLRRPARAAGLAHHQGGGSMMLLAGSSLPAIRSSSSSPAFRPISRRHRDGGEGGPPARFPADRQSPPVQSPDR